MDEQNQEKRLKELYTLVRQNLEIERAQREDLKSLDENLQKVASRLLMSTVIIYLVFAALCVLGAYLWIDLTTRSCTDSLAKSQKTLKAAQQTMQGLKQKLDRHNSIARNRSERVAKYLQRYLVGEGRKLLKEYDQVASLAQTPLERMVVNHVRQQLRREAGLEAYAEGVAAYNQDKAQSYKTAVEKLELALKYDSSGGHVPALRYYLGVTYYKLQRFRKATKQLEALAQSSRAAELLDGRALFHLAHAHDLLKQERRARKYYRKYLKKFPKGPHAGLVRQKLKQLPRSRR
jgi:tetratricopeptide (TPR) repeat protein